MWDFHFRFSLLAQVCHVLGLDIDSDKVDALIQRPQLHQARSFGNGGGAESMGAA